MLEIKDQIFTTINKSNNILITFPKNPSGDAICSSIAIFSILKKMDKKVTIVCDNFVAQEKYNFLTSIDKIQTKLINKEEFVININTSKKKIDSVKYEKNKDSVDIIIKPKENNFINDDITLSSSSANYDLIFTVASPDLESLGKIFSENVDMFYKNTIINIDKSPDNEQFGQINLINLSASSVSEIVYSLIKNKAEILNEKIAETLLTGIINETNSFRSLSVTPYTLSTVSELIALGASREKIVKNLFQVYSVNNLKLWGRVLARLKEHENGKVVWSLLTKEDFTKTDTTETDAHSVIDELIINMPNVKITVLFYQGSDNNINVIIKNRHDIDIFTPLEKLNPSGNNKMMTIIFKERGLVEIEKEIISHLKKLAS